MMIQRETYIDGQRGRYFTRIYQSKPMEEQQETIVLVHGLGLSGTYMHLLAKELQHDYLVLVPDMPGFGYSNKPQHVLNIQELGEALHDWSHSAHVKKAWYLGNSTGCQIITDLAFHYPDRVKGIILQGPTIDPSMRRKGKQIWKFLQNSSGEPSSQMLNMMKDYSLSGIKRVTKTLDFSMIYKTEDFLPMINLPALVVRGDKDEIVSHEWATRAASLLPKGQYKVIPGAAHTIPWAMPKQLAALTIEFIEKFKVEQYESAVI
jgi:2-hydroxy-6-oxonona-2,4-dienedioate hydrolase